MCALQGFMYSNDHEEGQMVADLPVYEIDIVDSLGAEHEAITAKEGT